MNYDVLPILIGIVIGLAVWALVIHPMQLRAHERRRRAYGLPIKRKLPEDK